jgi:hypothetical protein
MIHKNVALQSDQSRLIIPSLHLESSSRLVLHDLNGERSVGHSYINENESVLPKE